MKYSFAIVITLLLSFLMTSNSVAEDSPEFAVKPNRGLNAVQHRQLDTLFAALKASESELEALGHEREIWRIWTAPIDKKLGQLMDKAIVQMQQSKFQESLGTLDHIVKSFPKYAEGWNQRSLAHFQLKNYKASLSDIAATLKLEPRHFGALSGRGMIYWEQGQMQLAEQDILRAMRYHPYVQSRSLLLSIPVQKTPKPYI